MSAPINALPDQRVLERLRAEYLEMPGMKLTMAQVRRLCGIEESMCQEALDEVVKTLFLCRKSDGTYVRSTEGSAALLCPVKATLSSTSLVRVARRAS